MNEPAGSAPLSAAAARLLDASHRFARRAAPPLQAVALIALAALLDRFGDVRVHGREHIPARGRGYIVAANHPSVLDAIFVALPLGRYVRFMGKSELFSARWARWLSRLGAFPVRRGVWDEQAFATATAVLEQNGVVAIFPEGGTSPPGGGYREAKSGIGHVAQLAGATVLPIHLDGVRELYRPWKRRPITIEIGEPLSYEHSDEPVRARSEQIASEILDAVRALHR